eukprot:CFRG4018T1
MSNSTNSTDVPLDSTFTPLANTETIVYGCLIFVLFWIVISFQIIPFLPVGRVTGSLITALLMVVFGVLSVDEAIEAIDVSTLMTLFGTMLISSFLRSRSRLFGHIGRWIGSEEDSGRVVLMRTCCVSAISATYLTNDTACISLTPLVLSICDDLKLAYQPMLIALATSANIASALTTIGNPQTIIVGILGDIDFLTFLKYMALPVVVGLAVNTLCLLAVYSQRLGSNQGCQKWRKRRTLGWLCKESCKYKTEDETIRQMKELYEGFQYDDNESDANNANCTPNPHITPRISALHNTHTQTFNTDNLFMLNAKPTNSAACTRECSDNFPSHVACVPVRFAYSADTVDCGRTADCGHTTKHSTSIFASGCNIEHNDRNYNMNCSVDSANVRKGMIAVNSAPMLPYTPRITQCDTVKSDNTKSASSCVPISCKTSEITVTIPSQPVTMNRHQQIRGGHTESECIQSLASKPTLAIGSFTSSSSPSPSPSLSPIPLSSTTPMESTSDMELKIRMQREEEENQEMLERLNSRLPCLVPAGLSLCWRKWLWRTAVTAIMLFTVVVLILGWDVAWVMLAGGILLLILDWRDGNILLESVDYMVIVFFSGVFITTAGLIQTGVPNWLWAKVEPYCDTTTASGIAILSVVILVMSVLVSNVPTVIILGPNIAQSATSSGQNPLFGWVLLAFVSTISGNFIMVASMANLLVAERARSQYTLSVWNHARFGVISTLLVLAVGVPILYVVVEVL